MEPSSDKSSKAVQQGSEGGSALDLEEAGSVNVGPVLGDRGERAGHT